MKSGRLFIKAGDFLQSPLVPPFLLGFAALSFQILLMRSFNVHFAGNELSFGVILGFWLFWTGLGSLTASKVHYSRNRLLNLFRLSCVMFPITLALLRMGRFFWGTLPGEIQGLAVMLLFAFFFTFLICFPMGLIFVFIAKDTGGRLAHVYLYESAGSAAGGMLIYFVVIPLLSNWQAAALASFLILAILPFSRLKAGWPSTAVILVGLGMFWAADMPLQKQYWHPFILVESMDSPYGKLQVLKTAEQISLYQNHAPVYFYPNQAAAEESVHFALLYRPLAEKVLLIGGGAGGALQEILKYPQTKVDYVEIDPAVILLSQKYLPPKPRVFLNHPRVNIFYRDGRDFIRNKDRMYDVIILNLPPPVNAQLNRFYTQEFFLSAKRALALDGVLSFRMPSSENYISPKLQKVLGSLFLTAKSVFADVRVVPGESNIFLASRELSPLQAEMFRHRLEKLNLKTQYMLSSYINTRLTPQKIRWLRRMLDASSAHLNFDYHPISYFYHAAFQSMQGSSLESGLYSRLSGSPRLWLLDFPLFFLIILMILLGIRKHSSSFFLLPLALMGLTVIMMEIILIIAFQAMSGFLYQTAALLFSSYMAGLTIGAYLGTKRRRPRIGHMMVIQFQLMLLVLGAQWLLQHHLSGWMIGGLLFLLGLTGGEMFIVSNRLYLMNKINYGAGYGLELLGSFFGALFVSSLLIPLLGLMTCLNYLFFAGSICLLYLFWGWKLRRFSC